MKLAIMQPYLFPYIGYFQLINLVDVFVIYDNIQYTKKGWINRNRILVDGKDNYITFPLKKDSDYLNIEERYLSVDFDKTNRKLINKIDAAYRKAPFFKEVFPIIKSILIYQEKNLFKFIENSLKITLEYLNITNNIVVSSQIKINNNLKSQDKVLAICKRLRATEYINPIGGISLYQKEKFQEKMIKLHFIKTNDIIYKQFDSSFISFLSIIDVLMFNSKEEIHQMLQNYELI